MLRTHDSIWRFAMRTITSCVFMLGNKFRNIEFNDTNVDSFTVQINMQLCFQSIQAYILKQTYYKNSL